MTLRNLDNNQMNSRFSKEATVNTKFHSLMTLESVNAEKIELLRQLGINNLGDLLAYEPFRYAGYVRAAKDRMLRKEEIVGYLDQSVRDKDLREILALPVLALRGVGKESAGILDKLGIRTIADLAGYQPFAEAEEIVTRTVSDDTDPYAPACVLPTCKKFTRNTKSYASFFKQEEIRDLSVLCSPASEIARLFCFSKSESKIIYLGYSVSFLQDWIYTGIHLGEPLGSVSLFMGQDTQVSILDWKRINQTFRTEDTRVAERLSNLLMHQRAVDEVARATAEEHQYGGTSSFAANAATAGSFVAAGALVGGVGGGISGAIAGLVLGNAANAAGGAPTIAGTAIGTAVGSLAGAAAGSLIFSGAATLGFVGTDAEGDREIYAQSAQDIQQRTVQNSSSIRSFWSNIVSQSVQQEEQTIRTDRVTNHNRIHALNALYFEVLNEYRLNISAHEFAPILFVPFKPLIFTEGILRRYWWIIRTYLADRGLVDGLDQHFTALSSDPSPASELAELPRIEDIKTSSIEAELNLDGSAMEELVRKAVLHMFGVVGDITDYLASIYDGMKRDQITVSLVTSQGTFSLSRSSSPNTDPNFIGRYRTSTPIAIHTIEKIQITNDNTEFSLGPIDINELIFEQVTAKITVQNKAALQEALPNIGTLEPKQTLNPKAVRVTAHRSKEVSWDIAARLTAQYEGVSAQIEKLTAEQDAEQEAEEALAAQLNNLIGFLNANRYGFTRLILQNTEREQVISVLEEVQIGGVELSSIASTTPLGFCGNHVVLPLKNRPCPGVNHDPIGVDTSKLEALLQRFDSVDMRKLPDVLAYATELSTFLRQFTQAAVTEGNGSAQERQLLALVEQLKQVLDQFQIIASAAIPVVVTAIRRQFEARLRSAIQAVLRLIDAPTQANDTDFNRLCGYYASVKASLAPKMGRLISSEEVSLPSPAVFMEPVLSHAKGAELYDMRRNSHYEILPAPGIGAADPNVLRAQDLQLTPTVPASSLTIQNAPEFPLPSSIGQALAEAGKLDLGTLLNTNAGTLNTTLSGLSTLAAELAKASAQLTGDAQKQALATAGDVAKQIGDIVQKSLQSAPATPEAASGPKPPPPTTQQEKAEVAREVRRINDGSDNSEQKKEQKESVGAPTPASTTRKERTLHVRLSFESAYGIPITYDVLAGLGKHFRLFNELDIRVVELGSQQELFNPLYSFSLERWSQTQGELGIELDYGEGSFKKNQSIDIPTGATTMIVTARIASRDQTITRARSTSRTENLTDLIQQKTGVSAKAAKKIVELVDFEFSANFETTESVTDSDSVTGGTTNTVTEVVKVPTGAFDLAVQFKS
jgi:hypothetical protein